MLSRIADSMFWLNRYLERSEGMLRMLQTSYVLSLDKGPTGNNNWQPLIEIFTGLGKEGVVELMKNPNGAVQHLLLDPKNQNSLKVILNRARENARGMQDHITKEVWEQVNHLYHLINNPKIATQLTDGDSIAAIESMLKNCLLYTGITDSTMPRGMSWSFMSLGKYIERCLLTIELVDKQYKTIDYDFTNTKDILYWRGLLFSLSGYEFHLKNYRSNDYNYNVAHQVIFNPLFPHSIMYSLSRVKKYLDDVVKENNPTEKYALLKQFGRLYSNVEFADFEWIKRSGMPEYLEETRGNLLQFSRALSQSFFSYS
ncbi:MAG: alpha-E domain-containing protein [Chitinophagaceae bacterium]|nr:alpha-E domain-containing protein [Chitinophagaceae bacterium]